MRIFFLSVIILLFFSCKEDTLKQDSFSVNIQMQRDPGKINPFYATTSLGREVYQYIFTPLADFHPDNLELYPILIERLPEDVDTIINGVPYVAYKIDMKDDVLWSDGERLTNKDYLFTMQMIKHPLSKITAWKSYFEALKLVELDVNDDTKLTVYFEPNYMLSKEAALTTFVIPSHIFDVNENLLSKGISIFKNNYSTTDSLEIKVVETVNASDDYKTQIVQLGPYEIQDFQTDEYIQLKRKENYWGNNYPDNVFLHNHPNEMLFRFVPDEVGAVNMAKEGQLDIIKLKSSDLFLDMKEDSLFSSKFSFNIPQIMQYYFICINNTTDILKDRNVRVALSHLADVDDYIQNIDGGLGTRTIGHINPTKSYYNNSIMPIAYNPNKAKEILENNGWSDTDGNGVLDKGINGKRTALELDFFITGSSLSQSIALLFQESALKAGVKINIVSKSMALLRKENLNNYNYDLAALSATSDASPDDLYDRWHSSLAQPGTRNQSGYSNLEADDYIEQIRSTRNTERRKAAYLKVQEIMHQDQPVIFLYSPMQKILISKRLKGTTTAKRPGYLANSFSLSS